MGGAGTDTLKVVDTTAASAAGVPAAASVTGVENMSVTSSGKVGTSTASAGTSTAEQITLNFTDSTSGATATYSLAGTTLTVTDAGASDTTGVKAAAAAKAGLTALYQAAGYTVITSGTADTATKILIEETVVTGSSANVTLTISGKVGVDIPNPTVTTASAATELPVITTTPATVGSAAIDAVQYDVSGFTGLENFTATSVGGANIKAAGTTAITLTNTGNGDITIAGGSKVTVAESAASGTGTKTITGAALTEVSLTGGSSGTVTVDNTGGVAGTTTETGTTLTTINLTKVDSDSTFKGKAITTLNISGATASTNTVTITNGTANHTLNINATDVGYTTAAASAVQTVADATATVVNLKAAGGKNQVTLSGSAMTTVNVTGTASELALATLPSAVDKVDGTGFSGKLSMTVASNLAAGDYVKTGANNDTVALGSSTVTSTAVIDLGAGNDKVTGTGAVASTASIVGGDGTDTIGVGLISNTSKAAITGFEKLDVTGLGNTTFDFDLAKFANSISTVVVAGNVHASGSTIDNLPIGTGLEYTASATGSLIITETGRGLNATSTSIDELNVAFTATANTDGSAKTVTAASLTAQDINTLNINSDGGAKVDNVLTAFVSDEIKTINVTGDNKFTLSNVYSSGTTVTSTLQTVDASASSGGLVLNTAISTYANLAVKLGSGDDVITVSFKSDSTTATSSASGADSISGITKATAAAVNLGEGYDKIVVDDTATSSATIAVDADAAGSTTAVKIKDGVVDFSVLTSGPTSFAAAVALVNTALGTTGDTVVFEYGGNSYLYTQNDTTGSTDDLIVKLTGLTGVTKLVEGSADTFYFM